MKVLIVEDDRFKLDAIRGLANQTPLMRDATSVSSLHDALMALQHGTFDLVILDMAIPSHTSTSGTMDTYSQPVGGLDILLFLASNDRRERIVILTQYPTVEYDRRHVQLNNLVAVLKAGGVSNVIDALLFDERDNWKGRLLAALREVAGENSAG